jgi:hypothetical protein
VTSQAGIRFAHPSLRPWVVNASSFILLGKIDWIDLIEGFAEEIIVPRAVLRDWAGDLSKQRRDSRPRLLPYFRIDLLKI